MDKKTQLKQTIRLIAESSEQELLDLEQKIFELQGDSKALEAYTNSYGADQVETEEKPYQVHEGIAIVELKGPLVARTTWMSLFMGATSYEDLRATLVAAATDPEIDHILIDADTPGGQVNGLGELSKLITNLQAVKPIDTYVAGGLLSAGYWLGSATRRIYASETSFVGSIGVVVTHTSYQAYLEKAGVKVTKIKSGERKQVGSSEKDLSAADKAYLQGQVNDLFALFKRQVLTNRPAVNPDTFDGSEYVADKALAMGLVDRVMSFDDVLTQIINSRESDGGSSIMAKKGFTAEQIAAAAASGAKLEDLGLTGGNAESETVAEATTEAVSNSEAVAEETSENITSHSEEENTDLEAGASDTGDGEDLEASAKGAESDKDKASTDKQKDSDTLSVYLENQLAKAADKITDLSVENRGLKTQLAKNDVVIPDLKLIAAEAANRMLVALGMSRVDMSEMGAEAIIKQYKTVSEQFNKTFKPHGLTDGKSSTEHKSTAKITKLEEARLAAVGLKNM